MPAINDNAYSGPLTAAELADYDAQRQDVTSLHDDPWAYYPQRAGHWIIGAEGAMRQPMAAEACTDFGAAQRKRRTWPLWIVAPLYCAAVVAFFSLGWFIFALPAGDTAKTLTLLIGAPLALIVAFALLARWLH